VVSGKQPWRGWLNGDCIRMIKDEVAVELYFSSERLNDHAGDPCWIDLTTGEAKLLLGALQSQLLTNGSFPIDPVVIRLDEVAPKEIATASVAPLYEKNEQAADCDYKQWICLICGWVYYEATGLPDDGIAPGTRWDQIPSDWHCPFCDVGKADFVLVEF
jgi:rubredoxin